MSGRSDRPKKKTPGRGTSVSISNGNVRRKARYSRDDRYRKADNSKQNDNRQSDNGQSGIDKNYLVGRNPVMEALNSGREIERLFIAEGSEGSITKLKAIAREKKIVIDIVERSRLDRMVPGETHQGVVAEIAAYKYSEMEDVFAKAESSGEDPFIIVLDEIEDPHNLGAIIRTAECAGAHGVIIPKRRASGLNVTAAKSSAGAIETMPVVRVSNITRTIDELKERGIWIAVCDMDGESYYDANLSGPIAIVIGNEGKGISRLVKEHCDFTVSIPLCGSINSLNASNAGAVVMYEVRRQRSTRSGE